MLPRFLVYAYVLFMFIFVVFYPYVKPVLQVLSSSSFFIITNKEQDHLHMRRVP